MRAVQNDEPVDRLRVFHCHGPGDPATPVMSNDVRALRVERMDKRHDVFGDDRCAIRGDSSRLVARPEAAEVGRDHPETTRKLGYLLAPGARCLGKAVKQEDELALSFHHAVKADTVDLDIAVHRVMLARSMPLLPE